MTKKGVKLKVEGYGDMLAQVMGKKLVSFTMFGSYQGEWFGVLRDGQVLEFWRGSYGSCSGCDFLASEGKYLWGAGFRYEITKEKAREYFKDEKPFLVADEKVIMGASIKELKTLLPKKVLDDVWGFDMQEFYNDLHKPAKAEKTKLEEQI